MILLVVDTQKGCFNENLYAFETVRKNIKLLIDTARENGVEVVYVQHDDGPGTDLDSRKISSTNTLERLNREIRRRSSVVGIFPSTDSYIRLITSYLLEYTEDWQTERCYMNAGSIKVQKDVLFNAA